jgi:general nucleoside transport system ATP-binding protein
MEITLRDIHKRFGMVHANKGITVEIAESSIHGILGENGAGKSTLMKILAGLVRKTSGTILLAGKPVEYRQPAEATRLGIGMLYQDPLDFPSLSVLENFMMGRSRGLSSGKRLYREQLKDLAGAFGFHPDPDRPVRELTVGERQQLELLRLLALGVQVLILDEPTTGITSLQREMLFGALKKLAALKKTILFVSHKLEDVEMLCHKVTVLRAGRVSGEMDRPFDTHALLRWMFGAPPAPPPCAQGRSGNVTLAMDHVSAAGGRSGLRRCTVSIHEGEVVGLAGLAGSGQDVFLRVAAGLSKPRQGRVHVVNENMAGKDYHAFKAKGGTFLPAARLEEGLIPGLTITEHLALQQDKGVQVRWTEAQKAAGHKIGQFRIVGNPLSTPEDLSGGNQQRLLLALIPEDPKILLLEDPTRGLDLDSVRWVWEHLVSYCAGGTSIVFSSAELDEILQVADRVLVFYNGVMVKDVKACDTTLMDLGQALAGKV